MTIAVSIIIPVLGDDDALRAGLLALQLTPGFDQGIEVIVADGAHSDTTRAIALEAQAQYVPSDPGRGVQMNRGARESEGTVLLFLHADCRLPPDGIHALLAVSNDPQSYWGSFKQRIDGPNALLRVIEWGANVRASTFALPYGDQGIFTRRDLFERVGGYCESPLLEDVQLAQALGRIHRPVQLAARIRTDPRRWKKRGIGATTVTNWRIMWHYFCGNRSVEELAKMYYGRR